MARTRSRGARGRIAGGALLLALLGSPPAGTAAQPGPASPYAGFTDRPIKALSAEEIDGLRNGRGLGTALPAELNGYPGPMHVLDLADSLALTPAQHQAVRDSFDRMKLRAVALGEALIRAEADLDSLFRSGTATPPAVGRAVRESARLRGELRLAHIEAHLEMRAVLSPGQVERYGRLRGYTTAGK